MTKFYAQEKRVFDLNKVTVVGSPSISEDGVASGFSKGSNYITASLNISNYNTLVIQNKFNYKVNTNESGATYWLNGIKFRNLVSSSGVLQFYTEEESNYYSVAYPANNFKDGDVVETRVTLTNSLINTEVWVNGIALTPKQFSNVVSLANITSVGLGSSYYQGNNPFQGSIDLTAFKIYVDGELVYSPTKPICYLERRKEGFDLSKFTVVGSPTITEDGVASNVGVSDRVQVVQDIDFNKDIEIKWDMAITTEQTGKNAYYVESQGDTKFQFYHWLGNSFANIYIVHNGSIILQNTLPYYTESTNYIFKSINKTFYIGYKRVSDSEYTFITIGTATETLNLGSGVILGYSTANGRIKTNLPSFSITVDGKEVFTGAKEKFYAMRGM